MRRQLQFVQDLICFIVYLFTVMGLLGLTIKGSKAHVHHYTLLTFNTIQFYQSLIVSTSSKKAML